MTIRVLVAGLGNMGRSHALAYHHDPAFEIVGLVNRSAVELPPELQGYPLSADYAEALARLQPDLVCIATYSDTHADYAVAAMQAGDDATLRAVIEIFEEWELEVIGAHEIAPDLVPSEGVLCGAVSEADGADAARGAQIVAALGAADVGQGAVVAGGLCLAVEALPGTDAMLAFAASHTGLKNGAKGVFYKAPKPAQDLRIDLPAIGIETVKNAAAAGLAGIAWQAGGVMLLDRAAVVAAAQEAGLFLWARAADATSDPRA